MRFPTLVPTARPLALALVLGATALVGQATPAGAATTPTVPTPTINKAALGSGGGPFCDGIRTNFSNVMGSGLTELLSNGIPDPAKVKAYFEKNAAINAKLITLAPASIKPSMTITLKSSQKMLDALKKANYDFKKLDSAAMSVALKPTAETKAAQDKVNAFMTDTCHIDLNAVMGIGILMPTTTTKK